MNALRKNPLKIIILQLFYLHYNTIFDNNIHILADGTMTIIKFITQVYIYWDNRIKTTIFLKNIPIGGHLRGPPEGQFRPWTRRECKIGPRKNL